MAVNWGVSPIAWMNDDLPELGAGTPIERVLEEAQAIGFDGIEMGHAFSQDAAALSSLLSRYRLQLVGGWYGASLLTRSAEAEIAAMTQHVDLLQRMGSDVVILAETSNSMHGDRARPLDTAPRLDDRDWATLGCRLDQVADHLAKRDLKLAYHHHLGTVVETQSDLRHLLDATGARVGLTIDTGHALLAGIDPAAVVWQHPERIVHVHCKDIRRDRHAGVRESGGSFLDGVLAGMFTVPGDGDADFEPFLRALAAMNYAGWIVIEAEQDPAIAPPERLQRLGLNTVRALAGQVGLSA